MLQTGAIDWVRSYRPRFSELLDNIFSQDQDIYQNSMVYQIQYGLFSECHFMGDFQVRSPRSDWI